MGLTRRSRRNCPGILSRRVGRTTHLSHDAAILNVPARLVRTILRLAEQAPTGGPPVTLCLYQSDFIMEALRLPSLVQAPLTAEDQRLLHQVKALIDDLLGPARPAAGEDPEALALPTAG
jgi:hypothetical protein